MAHYEPEWGLGGGETRSPRRGEARGSCHTPLEPSGPVHYGKTREQKCTTTQGSWEVIFYFDQSEASIRPGLWLCHDCKLTTKLSRPIQFGF